MVYYWRLSSLLRKSESASHPGSLTWKDRLRILCRVAGRLQILEENGEIFGRLTPATILLGKDGGIYFEDVAYGQKLAPEQGDDLLDFGLVIVQVFLFQNIVFKNIHHASALAEQVYAQLSPSFPAEDDEVESCSVSKLATRLECFFSNAGLWNSKSVVPEWLQNFSKLCAKIFSDKASDRPSCGHLQEAMKSVVGEINSIYSKDSKTKPSMAPASMPRWQQLRPILRIKDLSKSIHPISNKISVFAVNQQIGYDSDVSYAPPRQEDKKSAPKRAKERASFAEVSQETLDNFEGAFSGLHNIPQDCEVLKPSELVPRFAKQDRISKVEAMSLVVRAHQIMKQEPNILQLEAPFMAVGDLHGQFFDLLTLFDIAGFPGEKAFAIPNKKDGMWKKAPKTNRKFLFLGDYVDRGAFSTEVLLFLLALKVENPENVYLLRGNHETEATASYFGFKEECESKYGKDLYMRCLACFQTMPLAATVQTDLGKLFACHGGISPNIDSLETIAQLNRFREPGLYGALCDILWADPIKMEDLSMPVEDASSDEDDEAFVTAEAFRSMDFLPNPIRGCSYRYGYHAVRDFLDKNGLIGMIRAHEVQPEGFSIHFQQQTNLDVNGVHASASHRTELASAVMDKDAPLVVTVFSAPNYCGRFRNKAAFIEIKKSKSKSKSKSEKIGNEKALNVIFPKIFDAVASPEPLPIENETAKAYLTIEQTCPYIPTTLNGFIRRSIELGEMFGPAVERRRLAIEAHKKSVKPKEKQTVKSDVKIATATAVKPMVKDVKEEIELPQETIKVASDRQASGKIKKGMQKLMELSGLKSVEQSVFLTAKSMEEMNEMHPVLVKEKFEKASSRLESRVRSKSKSSAMTRSRKLKRPSQTKSVVDRRASKANSKPSGRQNSRVSPSKVSRRKVSRMRHSKNKKKDKRASKASTASRFSTTSVETTGSSKSGILKRLSGMSGREKKKGSLVKHAFPATQTIKQNISTIHVLVEWLNTILTNDKRKEISFERFYADLSDGVVLCLLMKRVKGSKLSKFIDPKKRKKKMNEFEKLENLISFQNACEQLGMRFKINAQGYLSGEVEVLVPCLLELAKIASVQDDLRVDIPKHLLEKSALATYKGKFGRHHGTLEKEPAKNHQNKDGSLTPFSQQELLALRLLYLMIDRNQDGRISKIELIEWSKSGGAAGISTKDADLCISAVDSDGDGFIGLEDFLLYAAQNKELWLIDIEREAIAEKAQKTVVRRRRRRKTREHGSHSTRSSHYSKHKYKPEVEA